MTQIKDGRKPQILTLLNQIIFCLYLFRFYALFRLLKTRKFESIGLLDRADSQKSMSDK